MLWAPYEFSRSKEHEDSLGCALVILALAGICSYILLFVYITTYQDGDIPDYAALVICAPIMLALVATWILHVWGLRRYRKRVAVLPITQVATYQATL